MKKLGITDKESARPCDWSTPALSEFNFRYKLTFQLVKTGQNFKTKMCVDALKEVLLKERKCKQYVSWYNCQHVLTAPTQRVDQRRGAKANGPLWFLLADVGSPRLRFPSGPSLSVLDSWSIVGSF